MSTFGSVGIRTRDRDVYVITNCNGRRDVENLLLVCLGGTGKKTAAEAVDYARIKSGCDQCRQVEEALKPNGTLWECTPNQIEAVTVDFTTKQIAIHKGGDSADLVWNNGKLTEGGRNLKRKGWKLLPDGSAPFEV
jgi:hypothetical protein